MSCMPRKVSPGKAVRPECALIEIPQKTHGVSRVECQLTLTTCIEALVKHGMSVVGEGIS